MCAVNVVLLAATLAMTAASGYYAADSAKKSGQYQAEVATQNAELDENRATQARQIGAIQEDQQRQKVRQFAGSQEADFAARGIDLSSGVVNAMLDDTFTLGETDALTIRSNAMRESWGYGVSATNSRNEGRFAKWGGKQQSTGTLLSTGANMTGQIYGGYQSGALGGKAASSTGTVGTKTGANRKAY